MDSTCRECPPICSIIPDYLLQKIVNNPDTTPEARQSAARTIQHTVKLRQKRRDECERSRHGHRANSENHGHRMREESEHVRRADHHKTSTMVGSVHEAVQFTQNDGAEIFQQVSPQDQAAVSTGTILSSVHSQLEMGPSKGLMNQQPDPPTVKPSPIATPAPTAPITATSQPTIPALNPTNTPTTPAAPTVAPPADTNASNTLHPVQPVNPRALHLYRTIYDCKNQSTLPGTEIQTEDSTLPPSPDADCVLVNTHFKTTLDFIFKIFGRDSLDDAGYRVLGSIHYSPSLSSDNDNDNDTSDTSDTSGFDNALWDGSGMIFGDGDGHIFGHFTHSLEVIAHELTHGLTQFTANMPYHLQSGALNEHMSDAVGSMVKQYSLQQTADEADWLIGAALFLPQPASPNRIYRAVRDLAAPGTAYRNTAIGSDEQPAHMLHYRRLPDDELPGHDCGGVHVNSGIPNRAFYRAAVALGGYSWEKMGPVWYATLTDPKLRDYCALPANWGNCFGFFANLTVAHASALFGDDVAATVRQAWVDVGVLRSD